jgi:hypothetical protein
MKSGMYVLPPSSHGPLVAQIRACMRYNTRLFCRWTDGRKGKNSAKSHPLPQNNFSGPALDSSLDSCLDLEWLALSPILSIHGVKNWRALLLEAISQGPNNDEDLMIAGKGPSRSALVRKELEQALAGIWIHVS